VIAISKDSMQSVMLYLSKIFQHWRPFKLYTSKGCRKIVYVINYTDLSLASSFHTLHFSH